MDLAQQKYPGKPWKYLLLDHHHIDHIGGVRAFAAAGATLCQRAPVSFSAPE
jgi:glyoxylase-like metal-dependent hydrolase (beta-lactamase superfamily II)